MGLLRLVQLGSRRLIAIPSALVTSKFELVLRRRCDEAASDERHHSAPLRTTNATSITVPYASFNSLCSSSPDTIVDRECYVRTRT